MPRGRGTHGNVAYIVRGDELQVVGHPAMAADLAVDLAHVDRQPGCRLRLAVPTGEPELQPSAVVTGQLDDFAGCGAPSPESAPIDSSPPNPVLACSRRRHRPQMIHGRGWREDGHRRRGSDSRSHVLAQRVARAATRRPVTCCTADDPTSRTYRQALTTPRAQKPSAAQTRRGAGRPAGAPPRSEHPCTEALFEPPALVSPGRPQEAHLRPPTMRAA